jgi:hypothetical protein
MVSRLGVCAVLVAWLGSSGCGGEDKGLSTEPVFADGKADVGGSVRDKGVLAFGAENARADQFSSDLEFHGYRLAVGPDAVVSLEVTQLGSSRGLDTTLYVYGPRAAAGGYGTRAIAFDDDDGWGRLSRLRSLALPAPGDYLVVVGTHNALGRGAYRLLATCQSAACEPRPDPLTGCHPDIAAAILACVEDGLADPDLDPYRVTRLELLEACADAEVVAPAWDALCARPGAPSSVCTPTYEEFALGHLPLCRRELVGQALDGSCVFGQFYRDLFYRPSGPLVIVSQRVLTALSPLSALEGQQVVEAVRATAHDDVTTPAEAFAVVDGGEIHRLELWDASGRRAFTAYELGAGDNSFGMYFHQGSLVAAARINDGDVYDCQVTWGPEMRPCEADADCAEGLRCTGRAPETGRGRCVDTRLDTHPAIGQDCLGQDGCPAGSGLVCSGAAQGGEFGQGICRPGWMRGRFASEPELAIPDGQAAGVEVQLLVFGLATVDTDVVLDLWIAHPRPSDLQVSLVHPGGTEVLLSDHQATGSELVLRAYPVLGFPGDESVNGLWRLRVVDDVAGEGGYVGLLALTVTSRWD